MSWAPNGCFDYRMSHENWSSKQDFFKEDMERLKCIPTHALIEGTKYAIKRTGLNLRALETEYLSPSIEYSKNDIHFCDEYGKSLVRNILPMKNALTSLYTPHGKTRKPLDIDSLIKDSATTPPFMQVAACDSPRAWDDFVNHIKSNSPNEVLEGFVDFNRFIHDELERIKEGQPQTRGEEIDRSVNYILGNWFHNLGVGVCVPWSEANQKI